MLILYEHLISSGHKFKKKLIELTVMCTARDEHFSLTNLGRTHMIIVQNHGSCKIIVQAQGSCKTHMVIKVQTQESCNIVQIQGACYFNL